MMDTSDHPCDNCGAPTTDSSSLCPPCEDARADALLGDPAEGALERDPRVDGIPPHGNTTR